MKISVDISMYPLDPEYGTPILRFIHRLREHEGLTVLSNTMSTQVYGEYATVLAALTQEMEAAFKGERTVAMVLKIMNQDLRA